MMEEQSILVQLMHILDADHKRNNRKFDVDAFWKVCHGWVCKATNCHCDAKPHAFCCLCPSLYSMCCNPKMTHRLEKRVLTRSNWQIACAVEYEHYNAQYRVIRFAWLDMDHLFVFSLCFSGIISVRLGALGGTLVPICKLVLLGMCIVYDVWMNGMCCCWLSSGFAQI